MKLRLFFSIIVTLFIMVTLFWHIPPSSVLEEYSTMNVIPFVFGTLLFFPMLGVITLRWKILVQKRTELSKKQALRITLVSCAFNAVAPSKTGDLLKAHDLYKRNLTLGESLGALLWEKYYDFAFLFSSVGVGMIYRLSEFAFFGYVLLCSVIVASIFFFFPRLFFFRSFHNLAASILAFRPNLYQFFYLCSLTVLDWTIQFTQLVFFFSTFSVNLSLITIIVRSGTAIILGLLPISFAGIGTRDAALVYLFHGFIPPEKIIAIGFLLTYRYLFPALLGLPIVPLYISQNASIRKKLRNY